MQGAQSLCALACDHEIIDDAAFGAKGEGDSVGADGVHCI
jgi:hypothetical protein